MAYGGRGRAGYRGPGTSPPGGPPPRRPYSDDESEEGQGRNVVAPFDKTFPVYNVGVSTCLYHKFSEQKEIYCVHLSFHWPSKLIRLLAAAAAAVGGDGMEIVWGKDGEMECGRVGGGDDGVDIVWKSGWWGW
ncbi:hypothetical protein Pmani_031071 [Petrolisthes manimaculis]|uniref:Uncharacterized protein n=1 Tax=Petrolisthes manimaculis TaxID=1843537 RepID=A0AAE1NW29_9EUCA|nr:hypothetical protein Pmani_031071 [Petrolisthes manimaculis]